MNSLIDVAVKRLSEQPCSEYELRLYLEKEFTALPDLNAGIDSVFKRLKELHLINDFRLASHLAQHYSHKGNRFITQQLRQKGIKEAIILQALCSLEEENVRALEEARKKLGSQWDNSEQAMALLYRFLSGRSFSYPAITAVIKQLENKKRPSLFARLKALIGYPISAHLKLLLIST